MTNQAGERTPRLEEKADSLCWHMITCEYPPQVGGVSDYAHGLAAGLAAQGDEVHVWCPAWADAQPQPSGATVHRDLGAFTPGDLRRVGQQLDRFSAPRRILVQWVPHGYGYHSMNLAFCVWLWNRAARHGDRVEIMVHEPYLPFRTGSLRQNAAALVHRLMTMLLLRAPERVWMSIPQWERYLRPFALGRKLPFQWLPIPSGIPITDNPGDVQAIRRRYATSGRLLIGHVGTFGSPITSLLEPVLRAMGDDPRNEAVLLMGIGSEEYRQSLIQKEPRLAKLIQSTGMLTAEDLSCHVAACDLLIQPYPDGVTSRRTSFMVGLSHGKPIVTTTGALSEPFWKQTSALVFAPQGDTETFVLLLRQLQTDSDERIRMGRAARALYQKRFDISYSIASLRNAASAIENSICAR
jgi:glycosyltransferase involved in cell wall biosynthesis